MIKLIIYKAKKRPKRRLFTGPLWIPTTMNIYVETERELIIEIRKEFGPGDYRISLPPSRTVRKFRPLCKVSIFDNGWIRTGNIGRFEPSGQVGQFNLF